MEPSKSILRRWTTGGPTSAGRGATPTSAPHSAAGKPTRDRKRVEITSPPQSTLSNEDATLPRPKVYKQTPLPRVALLSGKSSKKSLTRKESSRIAIKLKSIRLRAKRSPSIPSHRISKSRKRRRSKKSKAKAEEPAEEKEPKNEYLKEMGTINQIIKSPAANPLIKAAERPLSADELGQLLRSVGNVAKMQENIDGGSGITKISTSTNKDEDEASTGKDEVRKTKSRKSKSRKLSSASNQKAIKLSNYLPLIKQGGSSSAKILSRAKEVSSGKLSRAQLIINKASTVPTPIEPPTPKAPVKKLKSMKSQVKALIKEQLSAKKPLAKRPSKRRSRKSKDSSSQEDLNKRNSDSTLNAMSDLDLIKSAILNKRYYEESLALAQSSSKDRVTVEENPKRREASQSSAGKKQKPDSRGKKPASASDDAKKGEAKSPIEDEFSASHRRSLPERPKEVNPQRNTIYKDYKEPLIKNLANAPSAWQQQSLYPSAFPSVVNTLGMEVNQEQRWTTLNHKTIKKNKELKYKGGDFELEADVRRRIHPHTAPRRYEGFQDDENKILDSYATYMKLKGNSQPAGGKDPYLARLLMKNKV